MKQYFSDNKLLFTPQRLTSNTMYCNIYNSCFFVLFYPIGVLSNIRDLRCKDDNDLKIVHLIKDQTPQRRVLLSYAI